MISPLHGGGIISFEAFGEPVLKPAPDPVESPTDPAAFVLLPFCNRIAWGRAKFDDKTIELAPPMTGERHALHGEGWISEWTVEALGETTARLCLSHEPGEGKWPWAFEATQIYDLVGNCLTHRVGIQNTSGEPMPVGLGFHPYFPRGAGDGFEARVDGRWRVGDDLLPTTHEEVAPEAYWPGGELGADISLDHCFTGWDGELTITRKSLRISLTASQNLGLLHIYAPSKEDFVCAEPVSHMPDALNGPRDSAVADKMQVLQPGEKLEASLSYLIEKRT